MPLERRPARVLALLAKAEAEGTTPQEAEALTAKATELIAKYGIDRARLAADDPSTDSIGNKIIDIEAPWARAKASLLGGLASAMRCRSVRIALKPMTKVHVFGYGSDMERVELLYTSLLLQMTHGLAQQQYVPGWGNSARAWRNSWVLGFVAAVVGRVMQAEQRAADEASKESGGKGTELVLVNREEQVTQARAVHYSELKKGRAMKTGGRGYFSGYRAGQKADIGGTRLHDGSRGELS